MNKLVLFFVLVFVFGCSSPEDSLIGKWKKIEESYTDMKGNKVSTAKLRSQETYAFEKGHKLKIIADGNLHEGGYEIVQVDKDAILHTVTISSGKGDFDLYYRISFVDSTTMKKVLFEWANPDNKKMHFSGRAEIYERIE